MMNEKQKYNIRLKRNECSNRDIVIIVTQSRNYI